MSQNELEYHSFIYDFNLLHFNGYFAFKKIELKSCFYKN